MTCVKQRTLTASNYSRQTALTIAAFCLFISANVFATPHESIENQIHRYIRTQIQETPTKKIEIIVTSIDKRKKLSQCANQLTITLAGKRGLKRNNTVSVTCGGQWQLYVPVRVKTLVSIVTAKQNLSPGTLLNNNNLVMKYYDVSTLHGESMLSIKSVLGSRVKRHLQQGRPLLSHLICLVCKGDHVTLYVRKNNLSIKSSGIALNDGSMGQVIAAKNNSSGRRVEGRVVAVGEIEIN